MALRTPLILTQTHEARVAQPLPPLEGLETRQILGGYTVSERAGVLDLDAVMEGSLKFFGLAMVLSAGALWLLPGAIIAGDVLTMKLALTAAFLATGLALFWHANRGFQYEIQIDAGRREVRIATRNSRDESRTRRRIPMRDIESCFLRRSKEPNAPARLYLRLRGSPVPVALIGGPEHALGMLHQRLSRDLRPPRARALARAA